MNVPEYTILTRPASIFGLLRATGRNMARALLYASRGNMAAASEAFGYGGHPAVTRSLVIGLGQLETSFNYNPLFAADVGPTVIVLSNVRALAQALVLKQQGKIKKIAAGPNLVKLPKDQGNILADPGIDYCLVPSQIVAAAYCALSPVLAQKTVVWYAGVNQEYWQPQKLEAPPGQQILLYVKNASNKLVAEVSALVLQLGFQAKIVVYGKYSPDDFRQSLGQSAAAIFLSERESQGIALTESWAMNVPTLVWDPQLRHELLPELPTSPAPYLTKATGLFWKNTNELKQLLVSLPELLPSFSPRAWVLQHMTDRIAAQNLLNLLQTPAHSAAKTSTI